jgi:hypothetical protein
MPFLRPSAGAWRPAAAESRALAGGVTPVRALPHTAARAAPAHRAAAQRVVQAGASDNRRHFFVEFSMCAASKPKAMRAPPGRSGSRPRFRVRVFGRQNRMARGARRWRPPAPRRFRFGKAGQVVEIAVVAIG